MSTPISVGELVNALLERFPRSWAEPWDRVGLVVGDPRGPAETVFVTLDLDVDSLAEARAVRADLIVTHHPPFLGDIGDLVRGPGGSGVAFDALTAGMSVAAFHTNLDRAPSGSAALPRALGLPVGEPLESGETEADVVTTFVPPSGLDAAVAVMSAAGAGRVGEYEGCAFEVSGTGRYIPREGAAPWSGSAGEESHEDEVRIEMVCAPEATAQVVAALRAAHPYEEPVILMARTRLSRGSARLGRIGDAPGIETLDDLVRRTAECLGTVPRVWGDGDHVVDAVACIGGSASSLIPHVVESGADALVCGEVRYHVALEARDAGVSIVEAGHDATEWPLVPVLAETLREAVVDTKIRVIQDEARSGWWTWGMGCG